MKIVKVTYTAKAAYTEQNKANIGVVMSDLRELNNADINYHVCVGTDGKTFTHTAFFKTDDVQKILSELPSFQQFQQQLKASAPEAGPAQELLSFVGSSKELFL